MAVDSHLPVPRQRDVVFVLGAGASACDGVPLQRDLLPYIATSRDERLSTSWMGSGLREFLEIWFSGELTGGVFPTLEEVFGFLDYHRGSGESLGEDWPVERLESIRAALVSCIHHAVHVGSQNQAPTYSAFWKRIAAVNRNIGIVSLNYDPLVDTAFDPLFPHTALIDYGCHLMNYDDPPKLPAHWWWRDPKIREKPSGDPLPAVVKLLKIHGSLLAVLPDVPWSPPHALGDLD